MEIVIVAAVSDNGVIGLNGTLPWRIPEDMAHFKELTTGHAVVMGRKTWESLPPRSRPLPKRINFVLTQNTSGVPGAKSFLSPEMFLQWMSLYTAEEKLFVIGGAQVYEAFLPLATRLEITRVHTRIYSGQGQLTFFPGESELKHQGWELTQQSQPSDPKGPIKIDFCTYTKKDAT